jgi:DMSO/TMAO reductase YedYZ molybdopterin-dependent catalytic subunit
MVRQPGRGLAADLATGLLAGVVAALAMTACTLLLRVAGGIPLPVELASDRIVPTLTIGEFNRLAADLGGLVQGKQVAFFSSLAMQVAFGVLGGLALMIGVSLGWRREGRNQRSPSLVVFLAIVGIPLVVLWLVAMVLLWPVLESNYRGLPPGWSRVGSAGGLLVSFAAYGVALVAAARALAPEVVPAGDEEKTGTRARTVPRRALLLGGVALFGAAVSAFLARSLYRRATFGAFGYDGLQTRGPRLEPLTPNERFYVVTKNLVDPDVDQDLWRLDVGGAVEEARTYRFEDLTALPTVTQLTTLECISNPVGGHLMSNAEWQGVPLSTVLQEAKLKPQALLVALHGADGYVHTVPIEKAMDPATLVAFAMNGVPLPRRHGYPARVLVPGAFGEVSVKWVDRIEVVDHTVLGYYEKQGWKAQVVPTTSRIDRPAAAQPVPLASSPIDVGGVAFAGDRGISVVEVSTDGGASWAAASIDYGPSPLSWAMWSYPWRPSRPGSYLLVVRATDGTGAPQIATEHGSPPAGATGYHKVELQVV